MCVFGRKQRVITKRSCRFRCFVKDAWTAIERRWISGRLGRTCIRLYCIYLRATSLSSDSRSSKTIPLIPRANISLSSASLLYYYSASNAAALLRLKVAMSDFEGSESGSESGMSTVCLSSGQPVVVLIYVRLFSARACATRRHGSSSAVSFGAKLPL